MNIKFYNKNGFLLVKNLIKNNDIKKIKRRLKLLSRHQKNGRGLSEPGLKKSLLHSLHHDNYLKKLIEQKNWFQNIPKKLLKCNEIFTWNAKSNLKSRWHGSVEYYHQDWIYWKGLGFKSSNMLNCMIFIDDHAHENGGLWVSPGSHNKMLKHEKFLNINSLQKYLISGKILDKINKKKRAIPIECKAGSCLFFHSKLIHGSAHNISAKNRIILLYDIASEKNYKTAKKEKIQTFNRQKRKKFELKELTSRINKL